VKDDLPVEAPTPGPAPVVRRLALTPRPITPGLEVRPFPGFAPKAEVPPELVAGPSGAGEGGLLRAAGTFGCSALAGLVLTSFSIASTHTAGAPRSVRLERDARLQARAAELREAEEATRDRRDGAR